MVRSQHLRVYYGPEDEHSVPLTQVASTRDTVQVSLGELMETLGEAVKKQRAWPKDFSEEQITVSVDLYEVMAAYRQTRRSA